MERISKILTAKEIRELNINKEDVLSYDYQWENGVDNHYLCINGKRIISFACWKHRKTSANKILRMGLAIGWKAPMLTDEESGMVQANENGENPFTHTAMCANPEMNEISNNQK